ncbi:MAG: CBS domain-containing protein [Actinophytocola sp.]|uniref:CBS domain-containing protein n=1 Tax=Actinophytocola sp. TaxID=1872138 RepID=UPI0013206ECA|nr:CBS domain-containing protein [Actinophytocola sp.]MPZ81799.1 CBS domain-containing protein [Actinophytocola sp.]
MRELNVALVMTKTVTTATPETPFKDMVVTMTEQGISAVPVVDDDGRPIGVVSEADALAKQEFHGGHDELPHHDRAGRDRWYRSLARTAGELMTSPVRTIGADEPVSAAAHQLAKVKMRRLFVLDDEGRLVGVVSRRDLLKVYRRTDEEIRADIETVLASPAMDVPPKTVGVAVVDGMATVDGLLNSRQKVEDVSRIVLATPGVVGMRNNLRYVVDDIVGRGGVWTGFKP